jgi:hypothetical protein
MNRTLTRNTLLKIVMCALATAAVFTSAATARAQVDSGMRLADLGAVGVPRGQAARLNVFYHDQFPPGPCAPGASCFPPGPCAEGSVCTPASYRMSLNFVDEVGNVVATRAITLAPDKGAALVYAP